MIELEKTNEMKFQNSAEFIVFTQSTSATFIVFENNSSSDPFSFAELSKNKIIVPELIPAFNE